MTVPPPPGDTPPPGSYPPPEGNSGLVAAETDDDKTMGMLSHGLPILVGFWAPLIIMLVKKDSQFVQQESKEALNFQILLLIVYLVSIPLALVCVGFITMLLAWILAIVFGVQGALANNNGLPYRYPFNWRIVK